MRLLPPLTAIVLLVASAVLAAPATPQLPAPATERDCMPPCGYIYPFITMTTDLKTPISSLELPALPETVKIDVRFWWDFEQEGTGAPEKTDMKLAFAIVKEPLWLDATLDHINCEFTLIPVVYEYDVCTLTMTLRKVGDYPGSEEVLEDQVKRIMVFATSEDSGTFKRSYGVKDMRIDWDGAPAGAAPAEEKPTPKESPTVAPFIAVLGLVAMAYVARRRS